MELHEAKVIIQNHATNLWLANNCWGILSMATGTGKSKIFVDQVIRLASIHSEGIFVLAVPTKKLRDENWRNEFEKWGALELYETRVIKTCYASLNRIKDQNVLLVGFDEVHRLTENNEVFLDNNNVQRVLGLTATPVTGFSRIESAKQRIFRVHRLNILFEYDLLSALQHGVVAEFEIVVLRMKLDNQVKYVKKNKYAKIGVTEEAYYDYIESELLLKSMRTTADTTYLRNQRYAFLRTIRSKTERMKYFLPNLKGRFILFFGGIDQCTEVMGENAYHSKSGNKGYKAFVEKKHDKLGALAALNEGHSLPEVDGIFIVHMTTKLRDFVQRLGRAIRWRADFRALCYILTMAGTIDEKNTIKILRQAKLKYRIVDI